MYFHPLIIEFFWFILMPFRTKENIHTKAFVDVSRGRGGKGGGGLEVVLPGGQMTCLVEIRD